MPGMHQAGLGRECQQRGVLGGNHKFAFLSSLGSHFSRKRDLHSAPVEKRLIEFSSEKDSRDGAPLSEKNHVFARDGHGTLAHLAIQQDWCSPVPILVL